MYSATPPCSLSLILWPLTHCMFNWILLDHWIGNVYSRSYTLSWFGRFLLFFFLNRFVQRYIMYIEKCDESGTVLIIRICVRCVCVCVCVCRIFRCEQVGSRLWLHVADDETSPCDHDGRPFANVMRDLLFDWFCHEPSMDASKSRSHFILKAFALEFNLVV